MDTEFWVKTKYEGYEVSNSGKIKSVDRYTYRKDTGKLIFVKGKELKQQMDGCGYLRVSLSIEGVKKTLKVHRIVAETFIENKNNLPQVNHLDGCKTNNNIENLEWCSNSENQKHAIKHGLKIPKTGENSPRFSGAVLAFDKNGKLSYILYGNSDMKNNGFDYRLVSACLKGKRKSHRGFTFKKE